MLSERRNNYESEKRELEALDLPYSAIEDNIIDTTRWSEIHEIVFKMGNKFYQTSYSCGATEMQDESPWEHENEVEITEVEQKEVLVKRWVPVNS